MKGTQFYSIILLLCFFFSCSKKKEIYNDSLTGVIEGTIFSSCFSKRKIELSENNLLQLPPEGCIPNAEIAMKVTEIIWIPIFGEEYVQSVKPFVVTIKDDSVWIVTGKLPPKGWKGGCGPYIEMSKRTGQVYKIDEYR